MSNLENISEEVLKSIAAAYDSVTLINELNAKESLTQIETDTLNRNIEHIRIMMGKTWFVEGLTVEQIIELQAI